MEFAVIPYLPFKHVLVLHNPSIDICLAYSRNSLRSSSKSRIQIHVHLQSANAVVHYLDAFGNKHASNHLRQKEH
jgi:hypothetical protein